MLEWSDGVHEAVSQCMFSQMNCDIVERVATDTYIISCNTIKNLIDS